MYFSQYNYYRHSYYFIATYSNPKTSPGQKSCIHLNVAHIVKSMHGPALRDIIYNYNRTCTLMMRTFCSQQIIILVTHIRL